MLELGANINSTPASIPPWRNAPAELTGREALRDCRLPPTPLNFRPMLAEQVCPRRREPANRSY